MDTITPHASREKGIIRKYLHNNNQALDLRGGGEYYSAMTRHFCPRIANWMGRSSGQLVARTRGRHTNTNTINFLSPHNHTNTENIGLLCWFLAYLNDFCFLSKCVENYFISRHSRTWTWFQPGPHSPHGVVHTCCLCLMLRLKQVIPAPSDFSLLLLRRESRLFASSKGHYSELSQTWEGSEPIHIRFSPPSHAWEVLKYFLKYLLAARSEDNGFSMALLTQNGKRCRHCEVQTRHSDLDSNESDPGTGHWSQVWLHLHLQLNGHPQIYWMTSTVCCLATKHGQKIRGMERVTEKLPGKFFLNILLFFLHCRFFDLVLLGHKNNVRSRNIIFKY